jgi:hypothetical protein
MARRTRNSRFRRSVALGGALTLAGALTIGVAAAADQGDENVQNCQVDPDNDLKDDGDLKEEKAEDKAGADEEKAEEDSGSDNKDSGTQDNKEEKASDEKLAAGLVKVIRFQKGDEEEKKDEEKADEEKADEEKANEEKANEEKQDEAKQEEEGAGNAEDCDVAALQEDADQAKQDFDPAAEQFDSIGDGQKTFEETFPADPAEEADDAQQLLEQNLEDVKQQGEDRQEQLGQAPSGEVVESCGLSHRNTDNFIVTPGVIDGAQHIHNYFGNSTNNAFTTPENALGDQAQNCQDPTNKSSYWTPSITQNGQEVQPESVEFVYQGYQEDVGEVVPMPMGMVMIAGDAKNIDPANATAKFVCEGQEDQVSQADFAECGQGQNMIRIQDLPSCWDGENLDSDDHKSHVVFPGEDGQCPQENPVPLPRLQFRETYSVSGSDNIELSSFPEALGLTSSDHVDHMNLASPESMQAAVDCINQGQQCQFGQGQQGQGQQGQGQQGQGQQGQGQQGQDQQGQDQQGQDQQGQLQQGQDQQGQLQQGQDQQGQDQQGQQNNQQGDAGNAGGQ